MESTSLDQLNQMRAGAGADFAAKAEALAEAWVELLAIEVALTNVHVQPHSSHTRLQGDFKLPRHPTFLPEPPMPHQLHARADARHDQLVAQTLGDTLPRR